VHFYYYNTVYSVWYVTPRPAAVRNSCCCVNQVSQKKNKKKDNPFVSDHLDQALLEANM